MVTVYELQYQSLVCTKSVQHRSNVVIFAVNQLLSYYVSRKYLMSELNRFFQTEPNQTHSKPNPSFFSKTVPKQNWNLKIHSAHLYLSAVTDAPEMIKCCHDVQRWCRCLKRFAVAVTSNIDSARCTSQSRHLTIVSMATCRIHRHSIWATTAPCTTWREPIRLQCRTIITL